MKLICTLRGTFKLLKQIARDLLRKLQGKLPLNRRSGDREYIQHNIGEMIFWRNFL